MRARVLFTLAAIAAIGAVVWLWKSSGSFRSSDQDGVYIGAVLALTGGGAEFGKDELVGAQMAVDDINTNDPEVGLQLLVEDSRTQAKDGVLAYQKLMGLGPRPVAMLSVMSSVSSALAPLAQRDSIPLFCVAAAPSLTDGRPFVFRALPASDYQARTLVELSRRHFDYSSVGILYVVDEFGASMQVAFSLTAKEAGVRILLSEGIPAEATDFRAGIVKLISAKPDAIYIAAFGSVLGSAVRQVRELGYTGLLLTTLEIGYPKVLEVAGQSADGAVFVDTSFDANSSDPRTATFAKEFVARTKRSPSLDAVLAYDEIQLIYIAGKKNGFDRKAIQRGLLEIKGYNSANGHARILPNGDVAYDLVLKVVRSGSPIKVAE